MQDLGHTEGNTRRQRALVESQFRLGSPRHFSVVHSALWYRVSRYHHHRTGELKLFCIRDVLLCWRMLSFAGAPAAFEQSWLHSAEQITLCKCYCYHRLKKVWHVCLEQAHRFCGCFVFNFLAMFFCIPKFSIAFPNDTQCYSHDR